MVLAGGAQACNVFWEVGTSATLGATTAFKGTILADASVTVGDLATIDGRVMARDGAVTLSNNPVAVPHCETALSNTAPQITAFSATLTGVSQTVHAAVGAWRVIVPTATTAGYSVTVAASAPTVGGSASAAGTGGSVTFSPKAAVPNDNSSATGPTSAGAQQLGTTATTIAAAAANTGQGVWSFPADTGAERASRSSSPATPPRVPTTAR